jgi:hypothetical protein
MTPTTQCSAWQYRSLTNPIHVYSGSPHLSTQSHRLFSGYNRVSIGFLCCYLTLKCDVILLQGHQDKQCFSYSSYSNMKHVMVSVFVLLSVWHVNRTRLTATKLQTLCTVITYESFVITFILLINNQFGFLEFILASYFYKHLVISSVAFVPLLCIFP